MDAKGAKNLRVAQRILLFCNFELCTRCKFNFTVYFNHLYCYMKIFFTIITITIAFQNSFSQKLDKAAIHRIGDYGKLWTILTLFHPEMAYNKINADSLFIDNIGEMINNPTAANFRNAVQKMIDRLHDPYTTIEGSNKNTGDTIQFANRPLLKWLADSIALLHFDSAFVMQNSSDYNNTSLLQLIDTIKNAHGIIIDLRKKAAANDGFAWYYEAGFIQQLISHITTRPISYPAYRTRIHYGHESQTSDMSSSFYYQGWFLKNGSVIYPGSKTIHKPVCLLINRYDEIIRDGIVAMQNEGVAKVIADGSLGNFEPNGTYPMELTDSVKVNLRLTEVVYTNGSKAFSPDALIIRNDYKTKDTLIHLAVDLLKSKRESKKTIQTKIQNQLASGKVAGYDSLAYPSAPLRLLGLMRYWTAINYFCPNKDRITKNWDSVLYEYVHEFLEAKDSLDYALTAARLIKEINDGHGFFASPVHSKMIAQAPELQLKYVENKTIVYKVFNDSLKKSMAIGDEVIAVDDRPIKRCRDSIGQYIGASNNASLQRDITPKILAGETNTFLNLKYLHNGIPKTIRLSRKVPWYQYYYTPSPTGAIWKKINDKVGYVDLGRLEVVHIDSMFSDFKNTDVIIIDNRSYPKGTVWTLINYLTEKTVKAAKGATVIADSPDPLSQTVQESVWELPVTPKPQYRGKIIILVNEITQSQAEYSCMVLQAACKNVTIVGSQTAGADGDVTGILLPGGIRTAFSGHGIHYPDGRPTQGIGIVPDIKIKPTIKGIKAGRDEVLERAILFAKTGK